MLSAKQFRFNTSLDLCVYLNTQPKMKGKLHYCTSLVHAGIFQDAGAFVVWGKDRGMGEKEESWQCDMRSSVRFESHQSAQVPPKLSHGLSDNVPRLYISWVGSSGYDVLIQILLLDEWYSAFTKQHRCRHGCCQFFSIRDPTWMDVMPACSFKILISGLFSDIIICFYRVVA